LLLVTRQISELLHFFTLVQPIRSFPLLTVCFSSIRELLHFFAMFVSRTVGCHTSLKSTLTLYIYKRNVLQHNLAF